MNTKGLLVEPDFINLEKYLQSGNRTEITDKIRKISKTIDGASDGILVKKILVWINQNTIRLNSSNNPRKFKRTATEILESRERTGCCDSSTLFTALARSKGIPTMQIITFCVDWAKNLISGKKVETSGHFFTSCYLKDAHGKSDWVLIDSDQPTQNIKDIRLQILNRNNRNIRNNYYAFAYVNDYSNISFNELKIDSIANMGRIQLFALQNSDKNDFLRDREEER